MGEKIFPAEVESVINRHPKVLESAVIGVCDPYWGEKVEACVVLQPGTSASEEEVIDFCRSDRQVTKSPH